MYKIALTVGGYGIAAVLLWLLLMAREDIGEIREQCNTEKALAVAEAERVSRETLQAAHERYLADLRERDQQVTEARALADLARNDASVSLARAQAEIDRLMAEAGEDAPLENQCLNVVVPGSIVRGMQ